MSHGQVRALEGLLATMQRLCVRLHPSCGAGAQMIHVTCRVLQRVLMRGSQARADRCTPASDA